MPEHGTLSVDWPLQVQGVTDLAWGKPEHQRDRCSEAVIRTNLSGSKGIHLHHDWLGNPDGIGKGHLTSAGKSGSHHVFGDVTSHIRPGSVNFGTVLPGKCTAAMRYQATVGIHHQLPSGQSGVCIQTSAHKSARWINQDLGILIRRQHAECRAQHFLPDLMLQLPKGFFLFMLTGHNDRIQTDRSVIFIFHGHLCFSVRQDSHDISASTACRQFSYDAVRQNHWHRHKLRRIIAGVSHHDSLIPGSIGKSALNRNSPCPAFSGTFHCPGDIRTLFVDEGIHMDSICFIACTLQHLSDDFKHLWLISAGDLSCHNDVPFSSQHFAGHLGIFVLFQTRIQNTVCN